MTPHRLSTGRAALAALATGILAALAIVFATASHAHSTSVPAPGDRVREAIGALKRSHFYVGPELRYEITAAQQRAIDAALREAPIPTYLIYWKSTSDAGYYLDYDALDQVMAGIRRDGEYVVVTDKMEADQAHRGPRMLTFDSSTLNDRPARALLAWARSLHSSPVVGATSSDQPSVGGAVVGGLVIGVLLFVVARVLVAIGERIWRRFA